jgi:hypothetical protein
MMNSFLFFVLVCILLSAYGFLPLQISFANSFYTSKCKLYGVPELGEDTQTILVTAVNKAFNGGVAGASAAGVQVLSLMWLR